MTAAKDPGFIKIVTEVAVLMEGRELFDESVTRIRIDDEGGGEFVVISQTKDASAQIKIDPHEWPTVREAIDEMLARCRA